MIINKPNKNIVVIFKYLIKSIFLIIFSFIYQNEKIIFIEIDNEILLYENNIDFSNYTSNIKPIAIYLPKFYKIKENGKWYGKGFKDWENIKKAKPLYKEHHQPRIPGDQNHYLGYYELITKEVLEKQIKLAKNHGIYGFGFYYYWFSGKTLFEKPLNLLLNNKDINFLFLLIWDNENWTKKLDGNKSEILVKQDYNEKDPENFIKDIKKYLIDERYIKINGKPIIGISEPLKIPNIKETILVWRSKCKEYGIGEIYIIASLNDQTVEKYWQMKLFNAVYQFPPRDSMSKSTLIKSQSYYYLYTATLYNRYNLNNISLNDFQFYRGSMVEYDNTAKKSKYYAIFQNYSPEQFYRINKKHVQWTELKYNKNNTFIFINAWNNWGEGTYLEPDEKYGYASINALSKAIFHLPYIEKNYNLGNLLGNESKIAIQVHAYYEDLINDIINITNNIPVKFDLYISTTSMNKSIIIKENIKRKSRANNYEVKIYENKGRDVYPFLMQIKDKFKKYKYICHLHTKKTKFVSFGEEWRNFLYKNLLGNKEIISEILTDFENNDKLGFIFPEAFHKVNVQYGTGLTKIDQFYMNYILKKMNKSFRVGKQIEFPHGDMFWAKVASNYQIFTLNLTNEIPKEENQIDGTIMHGIERIWLYLVKLNGYFYKKIFKYL